GRGVHARIGVHKILAVVGGGDLVVGILRIDSGHTAAVEAYAVQVAVVAVLARFVAVGGEVEGAGGVIHRQHSIGHELAFVHLVLEFAVEAVEVVVSPAAALGVDQQRLAVVGQAQRLTHDVNVGALLDDRFHRAVGGGGDAVIH